jgi:alanyl-tRNA synthetase
MSGVIMTEKLYYKYPLKSEFKAHVISCKESGKNFYIELNRTLFYPEGGGQPGDNGVLNDYAEVVNTIKEDNRIFHICDKPLLPEAEVTGTIDKMHRLDYMQQHTAQHILSAVFYREAGLQTIGIHLGAQESTIDLNSTNLTEFQLIQVEDRANRIINNNLKIATTIYGSNPDADINLRKPVDNIEGEITIASIGNYDAVPCAGVHLPEAARTGLIKILKTEKIKDNTRITFIAGDRAYRLFRKSWNTIKEISTALSTPEQETTEGFKAFKIKSEEQIKNLNSDKNVLINIILKQVFENNQHVLIFEQLDKLSFETIGKKLAESGQYFLIINKNTGTNSFTAFIKDENNHLLKQISTAFGGSKGFYRGSVTSIDNLSKIESKLFL